MDYMWCNYPFNIIELHKALESGRCESSLLGREENVGVKVGILGCSTDHCSLRLQLCNIVGKRVNGRRGAGQQKCTLPIASGLNHSPNTYDIKVVCT